MATLPKRIVKETERLMAEPSVLSTLSAFTMVHSVCSSMMTVF